MFLSSDSIIKATFEDKKASEICLRPGPERGRFALDLAKQHDSKYHPKYTYVYDILGSNSPVDNENLWQCVSCHKCEELCPYEVSPVHFIEQVKAKAFKTGKAAEGIVSEIQSIIGSGYAFPVTDYSERQRKELGLPKIKIEFNELGIIAKRTKLLEILAKYEEEQK